MSEVDGCANGLRCSFKTAEQHDERLRLGIFAGGISTWGAWCFNSPGCEKSLFFMGFYGVAWFVRMTRSGLG